MTGLRSAALVAGLALLAFAALGGTADAARADEGRTLFTFTDPGIAESSGLVDRDGSVYTVNDSGAGPVLYAVDPRTGHTTGRTTYSSDEVVDVEAMAPGRRGIVWVADIGDNPASRDSVSLYRVRPGSTGGAPRLDLTYPDGPRDAETLLAHPRTGRLFVVSKTFFGGTVYSVPRGARPGRVSRLHAFAQVPGLVTDGAFLPDGRHVVLRSYATASVYTFPGFERLGTFDLPEQRQGEGISASPSGRVLISSEGVGTDVLEVDVPPRLLGARRTPSPSASVAPGPTPADGLASPRRPGPLERPAAFRVSVLAGLVLLGAVVAGLRRIRRRNRS